MILNELQAMLLNFADSITGGDSTAKGLVMVWVLGTITYMSKSIPGKIWEFLQLHTVVQINIVKDGDALTSELFLSLERWLISNNKLTLRNQTISSDEFESINGFGYGSHIVFCKSRFYKVTKDRITQSGHNKVIETLNIKTLGRSTDTIKNIISESKVRDDIRYFWILLAEWGSSTPWKRLSVLKPYSKLFVDPVIKKQIDDKVLFFKNNRKWYDDNNVPYKLTIILHGEPGTGKTSLIRYISDLLNSDIYNIDIEKLNTDNMSKLSSTCRKDVPALIAMEDFECMALSREFKKNNQNKNLQGNEKDDFEEVNTSNFSLSVFLNMLQGLNPANNTVVVMTTNYLDRVDPAVYRKGRTDLLIEVGTLSLHCVKEYFEYVYKQPFPNYIKKIKPIKACDMEGLFRDHPLDANAFIKEFIQNYSSCPEDEITHELIKYVSDDKKHLYCT